MTWRPNVTVAAVVERAGRFLLVEERQDGRVVLNQPAGHLEAGETLPQAVQREVREETGERFRPQALVGVYLYPKPQGGVTYLRFCFAGEVAAEPPAAVNEPCILGSVWLEREELLQRRADWRSPMVLRCIDDYLAGHRHPLELLWHAPPT